MVIAFLPIEHFDESLRHETRGGAGAREQHYFNIILNNSLNVSTAGGRIASQASVFVSEENGHTVDISQNSGTGKTTSDGAEKELGHNRLDSIQSKLEDKMEDSSTYPLETRSMDRDTKPIITQSGQPAEIAGSLLAQPVSGDKTYKTGGESLARSLYKRDEAKHPSESIVMDILATKSPDIVTMAPEISNASPITSQNSISISTSSVESSRIKTEPNLEELGATSLARCSVVDATEPQVPIVSLINETDRDRAQLAVAEDKSIMQVAPEKKTGDGAGTTPSARPISEVVDMVTPNLGSNTNGMPGNQFMTHLGGVNSEKKMPAEALLESFDSPIANSEIVYQPPHIIAAAQNYLEIGVHKENQGWVKVKAEISENGEINASITASPAVSHSLRNDLSEVTAYMQRENITIGSVVVHESGTTSFSREESNSMLGQGGERQDDSENHRRATGTPARSDDDRSMDDSDLQEYRTDERKVVQSYLIGGGWLNVLA